MSRRAAEGCSEQAGLREGGVAEHFCGEPAGGAAGKEGVGGIAFAEFGGGFGILAVGGGEHHLSDGAFVIPAVIHQIPSQPI